MQNGHNGNNVKIGKHKAEQDKQEKHGDRKTQSKYEKQEQHINRETQGEIGKPG